MIIFLCSSAAGDNFIISGKHTAVYQIKTSSPDLFNPYSNNGFIQKIGKKENGRIEVHVEVLGDSLDSTLRFPITFTQPSWLRPYLSSTEYIQSDNNEIKKLAKRLTRYCRYQSEAVQEILGWVNTNIQYDLEQVGLKSALDVLNEKRGYCIGYSNLSLALLRAAGIPCRNVHGIFFDRKDIEDRDTFYPLSMSGVTLHRWIEVYYADTGWVFSDPRFSVNHVLASHIFLSQQDGYEDYPAEPLLGTEISLVDDRNEISYLDLVKNKNRVMFVRPGVFNRVNSKVSVWVINRESFEEELSAVVSNFDGSHSSKINERGKAVFVGLPKGGYELKIKANDRTYYIKKFSLKEKEDLQFDIKLNPEEESDAKVRF